jgi:hypothetical protein
VPRYQVTLDGKTFVLEGDHPPSEADARAAISAHTSSAAAPAQPPEEKSVSGFLGNVASSGGRFVGDIAQTVMHPIDTAKGLATAASHPVDTASAIGSALKNRYGSLDAIGNTLYTDPVGVAADLSTVLGGAGLAAKVGQAPRIARALSTASELSNPLKVLGAATEAVTRPVANTMVRGTLRAPAAIREDFGGSKAIANAVLDNRVYSEASANRALGRSTAQADNLLTEAQNAGTPGVSRVAVAKSVLGAPKDTAKLRTRLGVPDATAGLTDQAKAIFKNNPSDIPLTDAQAMKREAQTLAYEAGVDNNSVGKAAEIAKAKALRAGIEQRVPAVAPVNERSQQLLGTKLAFGAAEDRPRSLTNTLTALSAPAGFAGGGPAGAALLPMLIKGMDSPRAGALAGIGVDSFGKGMNADSLRKAALIARLMQGVEE